LGLNEKAQAFAEAWGLNPLEDIKSVTGYGMAYGDQQGVLLLEVAGDLDRLEALARLAEGYRAAEYRGRKVHSFVADQSGAPGSPRADDPTPDDGATEHKRSYIAVVDLEQSTRTLLIVSEQPDEIKATIDTLDGRRASVDRAERRLMSREPAGKAWWYAAAVDLTVPADREGAALWEAVDHLAMQIYEDDGDTQVELLMISPDREQAREVARMVDGLLAMAHLAGREGPAQAAVADLARSVKVAVKSEQVRIAMHRSSADIHRQLRIVAEHAPENERNKHEQDADGGGHDGHRRVVQPPGGRSDDGDVPDKGSLWD
jgi:hypothetical protein